ncbi:GNAT family N-acetyltransferase [Coleofasciculus sp. FACHB-501]|uniref:GNAT family N-acetyltransferase n=1 Tax=Cyanophyceae TaxID=3028117 RepID=UPI001686A83B|nr:GNAT family N-acetyltransferase [Coleofasciculus sp. FACHB-501]MBD1837175.1 GNAT family N-acetyltransferase [Coleofasciculus sp. FACHB-501]
MDIDKHILSTPWDSKVFNLNTFEIINVSEEVLKKIVNDNQPGHYTVKVKPNFPKKIFYDYGFYYCDTLIEPYCTQNHFIEFQKEGISLSLSVPIDELVQICHGAFNGRFHSDFNVANNLADIRYDLWLKELYQSQSVFGLMYYGDLAGFWGFSNNKIVLHALSEKYRGKGMAKYFWSMACKKVFDMNHKELLSSISASNMPVFNLYTSLGFKFRNPREVYHILLK